jgi:type IV conjugative transfer system protein TraE
MSPGTTEKEIYILERQLKREKGIRYVLIILLLFVGFLFATKKSVTTTIIQPAGTEDQSRWVSSDGKASQKYLKDMADDVIDYALIFSPVTAPDKFDSLLRMVSPESYGAIQKHILRKKEHVRKNQVSSVFYPKEFKYKLDSLQVAVKGVLKTFSGEKPVINEVRTYVIDFGMQGQAVSLKGYLDATGIRDPFSIIQVANEAKKEGSNEKK